MGLHWVWMAILLCLELVVGRCQALASHQSCRRTWLRCITHEQTLLTAAGVLVLVNPSAAQVVANEEFRTRAVAEYSNAITASRDTNISPKEAYDSILQFLPPNQNRDPDAKALDVGAGAGLSTSYMYDQLGYKNIDAVDWSGDAWRDNVVEVPHSVRFYELDDDSFYEMLIQQSKQKRYQIICYNFAVNPDKAVRVARDFLAEDGVLFAPINDRPEYWYKQTYFVLNSKGQVLRKSGAEVGAWSVQFQPDVTSNTCNGIWCRDMNGFNQKRSQKMTRRNDM